MKFSDIQDIWASPPVEASKALLSQIYFERANVIFEKVLAVGINHPAMQSGKISRRHLVKLVGCGYATLTQNKRIRCLLEAADRKFSAGALSQAGASLVRDVEQAIPQAEQSDYIAPWSSIAKIVKTSSELQIACAAVPDIPTIVFASGIHEESGDWFRHLVVREQLATSSAGQYAKILRPYLAFCRTRRRIWQEANDEWLLKWRNHLLEHRHVSQGQVNYSLRVVFSFYVFCEQAGTLVYRVGCHERTLLPEPMQRVKFPLTAIRVALGSDIRSLSWTTPMLFSSVRSSIGNRGTPTNDEIQATHLEALKGKNGFRDTLLMSFAEDTGGRRAEILLVLKCHIPEVEDIDELASKPDAWKAIEVVRKGGKEGLLKVQPDTLYAARAYLRVREALVNRFKEKDSSYIEPAELFISSKTGLALQPDSVTALVKRFFVRVGVAAVNIHRLRAKFAKDAVETLLDAYLEQGVTFEPGSNWIETILQQVAAMMGHKHPSSLRHYLTVALERRIRLSEATALSLRDKQNRNASVAMHAALERAKIASLLLADMDTRVGLLEQADALRKRAAELEALAATS